MEAAGYDDPDDFSAMTDEEVSSCRSELEKRGVPPGHVGKIVRALRQSPGAPVAPAPAPATVSARAPVPPETGKRGAAEAGATDAAAAKRARITDDVVEAVGEGRRVCVRKLKPDASEAAIRDAFSSCGSIVALDIVRDAQTGKVKGSAFLSFAAPAAATAAVALSGVAIGGRAAIVELALAQAASRPPAAVPAGASAVGAAESSAAVWSVLVSNLPTDVTREAVRAFLGEACGRPKRVKLLPPAADRRDAVVDFTSSTAAAAALGRDGCVAHGRAVGVSRSGARAAALDDKSKEAAKRRQASRKQRRKAAAAAGGGAK